MTSGSFFRPRRVLIGSLVIGLIGLVLYWVFSPSALHVQLARLRSQGLPTNAAELSAYYKVPDGVTDTTHLWIDAIDAVTASKIAKSGTELPVVGLSETPIPPPGTEWTQLEASRTFLSNLDNEMKLIRKAAKAGGMARFPADFSTGWNTTLDHAQELRSLARLLTLDAHVSAHDGDHSSALRDLTEIFSTGDALRREPLIFSHLLHVALHTVGCELAMELLPHCQWSDRDLTELQAAISTAKFRDELLFAFHGEQALTLTVFMEQPVVFFKNANASQAITWFSIVTGGIADSWPAALQSCDDLQASIKTVASGTVSRLKHMHVLTMFPALHHAVAVGARAEARQNCATVAIAAYRYRLQHGEFPKSLSELSDRLPGDAAVRSARLIDPFDGQTLRYSAEDGQMRIYSIGQNQIDDGGVLNTSESDRLPDLGYEFGY